MAAGHCQLPQAPTRNSALCCLQRSAYLRGNQSRDVDGSAISSCSLRGVYLDLSPSSWLSLCTRQHTASQRDILATARLGGWGVRLKADPYGRGGVNASSFPHGHI